MQSGAEIRPVSDAAIARGARVFDSPRPWGQRGKGIFTLGPIHEGMGRMVPPRIFNRFTAPIYSLEEIGQMDSPPRGVFVVDASEIVTQGSLGVDLSRPWADYTLGWIDPLGAHSDFKNPEVMELLSWIANSPKRNRP